MKPLDDPITAHVYREFLRLDAPSAGELELGAFADVLGGCAPGTVMAAAANPIEGSYWDKVARGLQG